MSFPAASTRLMSKPNVASIGSRVQVSAHLFTKTLDFHSYSSQGQEANGSGSSRRSSSAKCSMESFFINALVKASTCPQHRETGSTRPLRPRHPPHDCLSYHRASDGPWLRRRLHSQSRPSTKEKSVSISLNRQKYIQMLDYYRDSRQPDLQPSFSPASNTLPSVETESGTADISQVPSKKDTPLDEEIERAVRHLIAVVKEENATHDQIYEAYSALPSPGAHYISDDTRNAVLHKLSLVEKKSETAALRYLSIMDDIRTAGIPLTNAQWNSAIYLAGRSFTRVTTTKVEAALRLWKEMEEEAGIRGGKVTFSILFDIATKAGQYTLAEMILHRMKERNIELTRFTHVGIIFYHGLRGDGNGIRSAYRSLVDAGVIVDTAVLNCVITSLLRAGEHSAADQVYLRMRSMYVETGNPTKAPEYNWKKSRELGRALQRFAIQYKNRPHASRRLQEKQPLTPDTRTYIILLEHHVSQTGELQRVAALLDDMQTLSVPIHGRIFMEMFRGFAVHGGVRYTSWTRARLEDVWQAFWDLLDKKIESVYVGRWIVLWILRAFAKCSDAATTFEIWEALKTRWDPDELDEEFAFDVMNKALGEARVPSRGQWL